MQSCAELAKEIEKEFGGKYCTLMLMIKMMLSPSQVEIPTCIFSKKLPCTLPCICFFNMTGFCAFFPLDLPQCFLEKKVL